MENNIVEDTKEIYLWFKINPDEEEYLGEEWLEELNYFFAEGIVISKEKKNMHGEGYGTGESYIKCTNPKKLYEFLNFINDNRETLTVIKVVSLDKEIGNITYIENRKYTEYLDMKSVEGIKLVSKYLIKDKNSLMHLYGVSDIEELKNIIKVNEDNNYEFVDFIDSLKEI